MNRPKLEWGNNTSNAKVYAYLTELEKYCDELEQKIDKYRYPRFVPCTCGHNRRHKYVVRTGKGTFAKPERLFINECMECGKSVSAVGEINAIKEWNKVMSNDNKNAGRK